MQTFTKPTTLRLLRFAGGHERLQGKIDMEKELAIRELVNLVRDQLDTPYIQALSRSVTTLSPRCRKSTPST